MPTTNRTVFTWVIFLSLHYHLESTNPDFFTRIKTNSKFHEKKFRICRFRIGFWIWWTRWFYGFGWLTLLRLKIQCNIDIVITSDLVTILKGPFFNLLHKLIRFSDIMRFSDNFCWDQKCHYIESALYRSGFQFEKLRTIDCKRWLIISTTHFHVWFTKNSRP